MTTTLDALHLAESLRTRLLDLTSSELSTPSLPLMAQARALWASAGDDGGLQAPLWVEGAFPAVSGESSLGDMATRGEFPEALAHHLDRREVLPWNRPLYRHQEEALRQARRPTVAGGAPTILVTAPTGAGKTESFLLPMLARLWDEPATDGQGTSAFLLYPTNALVHDQVQRLSHWLAGQERITFFHFTSETPEDRHAAISREDLPTTPSSAFLTRQQARGFEDADGRKIEGGEGPTPAVVVTNYSMLEYMLCRPQDAVFFGSNLRVVVLDEAHLYNGTLAGEMALLLRRLLTRCGRRAEDVLFLAVSATIGSGTPDELQGQLRQFGAGIFSRAEDDVRVVVGQSASPEFPAKASRGPSVEQQLAGLVEMGAAGVTLELDGEGKTRLREDEEQAARLRQQLAGLGLSASASEKRPAVVLHEALGSFAPLRQAAQALFEHKHMLLEELTERVWPGADPSRARQAMVALLGLGASARHDANKLPLLPHRLHSLVRSPSGLSLCLDPACSGPAGPFEGYGALLAGHVERCLHCEARSLTLFRCESCGEPLLAGYRQKGELSAEMRPTPRKKSSLFALSPGAQSAQSLVEGVDPRTGKLTVAGRELHRVDSCPRCPAKPWETDGEEQEESDKQGVSWFGLSDGLTQTIVAETATLEMPVHPSHQGPILPARGRRLLAFSDSRREAARFGLRLTLLHERYLVRSLLARFLRLRSVDEETLEALREDVAIYQGRVQRQPANHSFRDGLTKAQQALTSAELGMTLDSLCGELPKDATVAPWLAELMDSTSADNQLAKDWSQRTWETNRDATVQHLRAFVGRELARRTPQETSLESLGLVEVVYPALAGMEPPESVLDTLTTDEQEESVRRFWPDLLALVCDTLRMDGAISLGSKEADEDYEFGTATIGKWMSLDRTGWNMLRFVGATDKQRRRSFAAAVVRRLGGEGDEGRVDAIGQSWLKAAFEQLASGGLNWVEVDELREPSRGEAGVRALRLRFDRLVFRVPPRLWRSPRTGLVWSRALEGQAPMRGCDDLVPVSADEVTRDARLGRARRELLESVYFTRGLWAEEHSAQRSPEENRRVQSLFEAGMRNMLSATTTLELGIDIGGLSGVLLTNVPPGRANYLQRAGRAGRRTDGSSVVITCCRTRAFDSEAFHRFGDYLQRSGRPPRVALDRLRIAYRHAQSYVLGEFFRSLWREGDRRGAMDAFGSVGHFLGLTAPSMWLRQATGRPPLPARVDHPPAELFLASLTALPAEPHENALRRLLEGTPAEHEITDFASFRQAMVERFSTALSVIGQDIESLRQTYLMPGVPDETDGAARRRLNAIARQLDTMLSTTLIEALADRQILPRFGFPVGVHRLMVLVPDERRGRGQPRSRQEDSMRLERSSLQALFEYVPGSRVLVGGELVTSRGVLRHFVGNQADDTLGLRGLWARCEDGHLSYRTGGGIQSCSVCQKPVSSATQMLLPRHGFSSAAWDPPKRSASTERVGKIERGTLSFVQGNATAGMVERTDFCAIVGLRALYREDGEIFAYNSGDYQQGFALCTRCGYADVEHKKGQMRQHLPSKFERHAPLTAVPDDRGRLPRCWPADSAPVLRNHTLAARQTTDLLLLDLSRVSASSETLAHSLGRAMQMAGANLLNVDARELGVLVTSTGSEFAPVLFDNVPGGVGHTRELLELGALWLQEARRVLHVDAPHDRRCERACLDCILTFDSQVSMDQGLLDRREALDVLDSWLASATPWRLP